MIGICSHFSKENLRKQRETETEQYHEQVYIVGRLKARYLEVNDIAKPGNGLKMQAKGLWDGKNEALRVRFPCYNRRVRVIIKHMEIL